MIKRWKSIKGYEGIYSVSNDGEVRSDKNGLIRKYAISNKGYRWVGLHLNKKVKQISIHVLVAQAFLGDRPLGFDVNHKDTNKLNNHIDNIEYISKSENTRHAFRMGIMHPALGENNGKSKLTTDKVLSIRREHAQGSMSLMELDRKYLLSLGHCGRIVRRELWRHI